MRLCFTVALGLGLSGLLACTQDFEQFRPGAGGAAQGGQATTGGGGSTNVGANGGAGGGPACTVPGDCPTADECNENTCTQGVCGVSPTPAGTPCATGVCGGGGTCVGCLMDADCSDPTPVCDEPTNTCVAPGCVDGLKNGTETGVDCGGPTCAKCDNGLGCATFSDCLSGFCQNLLCAPCGGTNDCQSTSYCDAGTDLCTPKLPQGTACQTSDQCTTGACVDGFCCNSNCNGTCEACAEALTGMADGTCSFIDTATDPDMECPNTDCKTGACSGTSAACGVDAAGTDCGTQSCMNGTESQPQCDANGNCNQAMTTDCGGHTCNGAQCDATCANDGECLSGFFCQGGNCMPDLAQGSVCSRSAQCVGNANCIDGFCCDTACGLCKACSAAKSGGVDGTCTNVPSGQDPDNECPGANSCNGNGACN